MSTYEELLKASAGGRSARVDRLPPDIASERHQEQQRRSGKASSRAKSILMHRHKAEYDELYAVLWAEINAERGPLPGDKS